MYGSQAVPMSYLNFPKKKVLHKFQFHSEVRKRIWMKHETQRFFKENRAIDRGKNAFTKMLIPEIF